jgi:hypothetical protein
LHVHNVSDVWQIEIHITESLVPGPSHLEIEITFTKLIKYKTSGSDQIPAELIQAGGGTSLCFFVVVVVVVVNPHNKLHTKFY